MTPARLSLGKQIAPLNKPQLLQDNNLTISAASYDIQFALEDLPIYDNIKGVGLDIDCRIGRDIISSLPLKTNIIAPDTFPLRVHRTIEIPQLTKPSIVPNMVQTIEGVRIFGMFYQHRIWQEIKSTSRPPTPYKSRLKAFSKSYTVPDRLSRPDEKPKPKGPSFWDLIYVILQPPLVLGKLENLYLPNELHSFQRVGIQFLMDNESALLADEMGTGKTVQTAVALRLLIQKGRARSALILCPLAVLRQWDEHIRNWAPDLETTVVRGNRETRKTDWLMKAHVYISTYDTLRNDIDEGNFSIESLNKFDVVVLDEAQYIKNPESGRAKVVRKLVARQRWALTGTPIENKIDDVASIFNFLRPGYLSSFDLYPARIREKISPYFLRRRKKDVLKDLPDKIRQEHWLELDANQRKAYDDALQRGQYELGELGEKVNRVDIFRVLNKLKQICNFAPDQTHSPKSELLMEQVETIIENGQKVIVFSQYIGEGVEKLLIALKSYGIAKVIGGQSDRDLEIKRFKEYTNTPVLVASVRAGGVGLNLEVASYVVHFDHWWNPAVMWQAEDRAHRLGQKQTVNVYSYWILDTIEEKIYQTLEEKGLLFENVIDALSETELDKVISTEDWLNMLGIKQKAPLTPPSYPPLRLSLSEIQEKLYTMPPSDFERVVKDLLRAIGYPNTRVTGRTGDGGVDVISTRNTSSGIVRVVAQCKRYKGTVGVETARGFMGAIVSNTSIEKGYLVTTGEFTKECIAFCEKSGVIVLLNGIQVANYVKQFRIQI